MQQDSLLDDAKVESPKGSVECLGQTFENEEARREHFIKLLSEKLKDPEFRETEGFPIGTDEAIIELSDPPYYTACPNPWLNDFVGYWESQKDSPEENYHREPFAADVSEGKNDPIYNAHSYHTKVPHKAIMRYILHYTNPGDIVFDGFCGTGMTGVAAKLCKEASVVDSLAENGALTGERNVIVSDLSPIAGFISSGMLRSVNINKLLSSANEIYRSIEKRIGNQYQTTHSGWKVRDRKNVIHENDINHENIKGNIEFTIYADVVSCPNCSFEDNLYNLFVDEKNDKLKKSINCPSCKLEVSDSKWEETFITKYDNVLKKPVQMTKIVPVLMNYSVGSTRYEKLPDADDIATYDKCNELLNLVSLSNIELIKGKETRRNVKKGVTHLHQFFTDREHLYIAMLNEEIRKIENSSTRLTLLLALTASLPYASRMRRFRADRKGGGPLSGTLYIGSLITPPNVLETFKRNLNSLINGVSKKSSNSASSIVTTQDVASMTGLPSNSVDYIFTDPPFGHNFDYSELNFFWEGLLKVRTNQKPEAIISSSQNKTVDSYKKLMTTCFREYYRVLKPGRWITVEFSNSKASVWNAIQSALSASGFIVANVMGLDKKQLSFKAVMTPTAVKQDLVISAYKPRDDFQLNFESKDNEESVWSFIRNHLKFLPVVKRGNDELIKIVERDPRILFDQVVAYFVRNQKDIPLSSKEFQEGLQERFVYRDSMIFLIEQVAEYDKARIKIGKIGQLTIFVDDEASAIEWMRQELKAKPKMYSEIHPLFLNELSGWKKNELQLELMALLEQNFVKYDGRDDVPNQIHTYLSTNFKDMRGLAKDDTALVAKAKDRWYVPDPSKAGDIEKLRLRALLREFDAYKEEKKKIKQPRAEALRAGFNDCWEKQDLQTILDISAKIPPAVLQEDEKLLMFYDNALTLTSNNDDDWD